MTKDELRKKNMRGAKLVDVLELLQDVADEHIEKLEDMTARGWADEARFIKGQIYGLDYAVRAIEGFFEIDSKETPAEFSRRLNERLKDVMNRG